MMRCSNEPGDPHCLADEVPTSANALTSGVPQLPASTETTMAFNPTDPAFINDPFPFYRALRETTPVHYEDSTTIGVATQRATVQPVESGETL